jgi:pseudouridine-5'-phosphate glycosidase
MNSYLHLTDEVASALDSGKPVVALESTIISHGFPYPANVECALESERVARDEGAVPATIAVLGGGLRVGLSRDQIEHLGTGLGIAKVSRRDLGVIVARGGDGATTVAGTMVIAALAGIRVFATGGIGGVHRGAQWTFDVSADLLELARTDVAVVCAGAKSILDLGLTLEVLETHGVPVLGYRTDDFPAFYSRSSAAPRVDRNGAP